MSKLVWAVGLLFTAGAAFAGDFVQPVASDSSATGALVLLALVGLVIAASRMAPAVASQPDPLLMPAEGDQEGS